MHFSSLWPCGSVSNHTSPRANEGRTGQMGSITRAVIGNPWGYVQSWTMRCFLLHSAAYKYHVWEHLYLFIWRVVGGSLLLLLMCVCAWKNAVICDSLKRPLSKSYVSQHAFLFFYIKGSFTLKMYQKQHKKLFWQIYRTCPLV